MSVQSYYARSTGNYFVGIKRHEGVGIKARGVLQSICNTKIRRKPYFQDYPDIVITIVWESRPPFKETIEYMSVRLI